MPVIPGSMSLYYFIMLVTLIIGAGAQFYVSHQLKKYSRIPSSYGITGADMARRMSVDKGISNVGVFRGGPGQDFFDPRSNSVTLGPDSFGEYSITAIATAVHEMGHAQQYAEGYMFMRFRSALVPVVNFCSNAWMIIFMLGLVMGAVGGATIMKIGIIMFAAVLLFQLVTLPVEFDASRRGLAYLRACGMNQAEISGAYSVLRACALTYVASALTALLQLLYMILSTRSED